MKPSVPLPAANRWSLSSPTTPANIGLEHEVPATGIAILEETIITPEMAATSGKPRPANGRHVTPGQPNYTPHTELWNCIDGNISVGD